MACIYEGIRYPFVNKKQGDESGSKAWKKLCGGKWQSWLKLVWGTRTDDTNASAGGSTLHPLIREEGEGRSDE